MPSARVFGCAVVLVVAVTAPRPCLRLRATWRSPWSISSPVPGVAQRVLLIRPESPVGSSLRFAGGHGELENVIARARGDHGQGGRPRRR